MARDDRWAALTEGRTDLVFELLEMGTGATDRDGAGTSLLDWCAYYGDVSAIRFLLAHGAALDALGPDLGLNGAAFHGHWHLCQFLLERGADANRPQPDTGETPLHAALSTADRLAHDLVVEVLVAAGADPNRPTLPGVPTGAFMRDARTRGETPLHRAAACGGERTLRLLLDAGGDVEARDAHGDTPLAWASWHQRPAPILRLLCYGAHAIRADYGAGLRANLLGRPVRARRP